MIYSLIKNKINIALLIALVFALFGFLGNFNEVQAAAATATCKVIKTATCSELTPAANDGTLCNGCSAAECARLNSRVANCGLDPNSTGQPQSLTVIIGNILRGLFGLLGTVFLVLVIYGGFIWMTAAGNDENINKAKKIITQAAIGLIVVVVAYALTDFIFSTIIKATETSV